MFYTVGEIDTLDNVSGVSKAAQFAPFSSAELPKLEHYMEYAVTPQAALLTLWFGGDAFQRKREQHCFD